ncbi:MAG: hypothetical protein D6815_01900, partial [Candidatus Dadabacteria bacterium]
MSVPALAALFATAIAVPALATTPFRLNCNPSGDTLGWAVDAGADFDGDGIPDIAFSAPCARRRGVAHVGLVRVVSGRTGKTLFKKRGHQAYAYFGTDLAFVGDLTGDGASELAVGIPGYDRSALADAGRVVIFTFGRASGIRRVNGRQAHGEFGFSVSALDDVNEDGFADYAVGAPGEISDANGKRTGRVHIVSGRRGSRRMATVAGIRTAQRFGMNVSSVRDIDSDGTGDFAVGSEKTLVGNILNAGYLQIFSGASPHQEIEWRSGAKNDRLGVSSAGVGDIDGDLLNDFAVGAPGATVSGLKRAGMVVGATASSNRVFSDPEPVAEAAFGSAIASAGDINQDGFEDLAVGSPLRDDPSSGLRRPGSVLAFSGATGQLLWRFDGDIETMRSGTAVGGGVDYDQDGVLDIISGNIGDAPRGRRGAGTVTIHSGLDGKILKTFSGSGGLSTRLYIAGHTGNKATMRGYETLTSRPLKNGSTLLQGIATGPPSLAIINEGGAPRLGQLLMAVGSGAGAKGSTVEVWRLGVQRQIKLLEFTAGFGAGYKGGVNVAAADFDGDDEDELVIVQADSPDQPPTGRVELTVYERTAPDPLNPNGGYAPQTAFSAFVAGDTTAGGLPINAVGANVATGDVLPGSPGPEIVVAPRQGIPVVRLYAADGTLLEEWLAYDPAQADGVNLAVGDIDGDGGSEVVTGIAKGAALVKAFHGDGTLLVPPGGTSAVAFIAFSAPADGVRTATADVDLDGTQEILAVPGNAGSGDT